MAATTDTRPRCITCTFQFTPTEPGQTECGRCVDDRESAVCEECERLEGVVDDQAQDIRRLESAVTDAEQERAQAEALLLRAETYIEELKGRVRELEHASAGHAAPIETEPAPVRRRAPQPATETPGGVDEAARGWASKLVYPEKRAYAEACLQAIGNGLPYPQPPTGLSPSAAHKVQVRLGDYRKHAGR